MSASVRVGLRSAIRENILISRVLTSEVVGEAEAQSFARGGVDVSVVGGVIRGLD